MWENKSSRKDWQFFSKWEKRKHSEFFLPVYEKNNWPVRRDESFNNLPYDIILEKGNEICYVDEKARQMVYDDFLVEIWQDADSKSKGWFYKEPCTNYLYAMWRPQNKEYDDPDYLYWIDKNKLKEFMKDKKFPEMISEKGYGKTIFYVIPWDALSKNNIAENLSTVLGYCYDCNIPQEIYWETRKFINHTCKTVCKI